MPDLDGMPERPSSALPVGRPRSETSSCVQATVLVPCMWLCTTTARGLPSKTLQQSATGKIRDEDSRHDKWLVEQTRASSDMTVGVVF